MAERFTQLSVKVPETCSTRLVRASVLIKLSHARVALLYARPASGQLRGISLVTRKPIEFLLTPLAKQRSNVLLGRGSEKAFNE